MSGTFLRIVRRSEDGRFVVNLPFRDEVKKLGDLYKTVIRRFMLIVIVGGHLKNANYLDEYHRHPMLIPEKSHIAHLIIVTKNFFPPGLRQC